MNSPIIGRTLAMTTILFIVGWTALRSLGTRPPASPSAAMPLPALDAPLASARTPESAVLAGGCFWGVQAVFENIRGVQEVVSGYSGGFLNAPSYEAVSLGLTGHAESVRVTFDPSQVTYGQLLMVYLSVAHDPTQWNRQGPDIGRQYRSVIFYTSDEQKGIAEAYLAQLAVARIYSRPIVTKVEKLEAFYPAEEYHQDYVRNYPHSSYVVANDLPKLARLKKDFPKLCRLN
jgi:peptide-methionine (S)-S-oxide reductase